MAHNLTDTAGYTVDSVSAPDDGDDLLGASVEAGLQTLANRTAFMLAHDAFLSSGSMQLDLLAARDDPGVGGAWTYQNGIWVNSDVSVAAPLRLGLPLPYLLGATITQVKAWVDGSIGAAHGDVPATMPLLHLLEIEIDGTVTDLGSQADTSGDVTAYETPHFITLAVAAAQGTTRRYVVQLDGEAGANASANKLAVYGFSISWTVP